MAGLLGRAAEEAFGNEGAEDATGGGLVHSHGVDPGDLFQKNFVFLSNDDGQRDRYPKKNSLNANASPSGRSEAVWFTIFDEYDLDSQLRTLKFKRCQRI